MAHIYKPPQGKGTLAAGTVIGIGVSGLLFLAIPLTQIFTEYEKEVRRIENAEVAPPPPPPPPDEPPPPPEEEQKEPPPEMEQPPPDISLDQLDMALNPGTGGSLAGDFALPSFDVNQKELGGVEIFDLGDVDSPPRPRTNIDFRYPSAAKRRGLGGIVKVEYIVDREGRVEQISIIESPGEPLSEATRDSLENARFEPATKGGRPVKVRMRAAIPYK